MTTSRLPFLCAFGLIVVMANSPIAQPPLEYMREPFAIDLRAAVQTKYPNAKVTIAGRHSAEPFQVRLTVVNITPPNIMGRPIAASPSTAEDIARAFLRQFAHELDLDADILELVNVRQFDYGKRGYIYRASFRPCYREIPVVRSTVYVEVGDDHIAVDCYNPVPISDIRIENTIAADSAVASVEWAERKRYFAGGKLRPVYGYGIISRTLFEDFFNVTDSSGRWIPYEDRVLGCQLVIFPQLSNDRITPYHAWRMYLGLGEPKSQEPFLEAFVDARSGEVLNLTPLGGGCVILNWAPASCVPK